MRHFYAESEKLEPKKVVHAVMNNTKMVSQIVQTDSWSLLVPVYKETLTGTARMRLFNVFSKIPVLHSGGTLLFGLLQRNLFSLA